MQKKYIKIKTKSQAFVLARHIWHSFTDNELNIYYFFISKTLVKRGLEVELTTTEVLVQEDTP